MVTRNVGGLGGLGGRAAPAPQQPSGFSNFVQSPDFGNVLQSIGMSLMSSPSNAPLSSMPTILSGVQAQSMRQRQEQLADEERQKKTEKANATRTWLETNQPDLVPIFDMDPGAAITALAARKKPKPEAEAYTLGAGETRYGPNNEVLAEGAPDTKDQFGNEKDLFSQYSAADPVKTYQTVRNSYERVRSAAEMGNSNTEGSGAADISLVFAYMKMLDPGSVVREGEFASAANAGGVPATVMNMYNNLVKGDKLTPDVRSQFLQSADSIYADTADNLRSTNEMFTTRAQGWNVNPSNILIQPETYAAPKAPTAGARTTSTGVSWTVGQ